MINVSCDDSYQFFRYGKLSKISEINLFHMLNRLYIIISIWALDCMMWYLSINFPFSLPLQWFVLYLVINIIILRFNNIVGRMNLWCHFLQIIQHISFLLLHLVIITSFAKTKLFIRKDICELCNLTLTILSSFRI